MKLFTKFFLISIFLLSFNLSVNAQLQATFTKTQNTKCQGSDCDWDGPSILINELMISPSLNDGSLAGDDASQRGEWIELYNPNVCEPVDISCYFLGSYVSTAPAASEAYLIPSGTIVPPGGFCVIRGANAEQIDPNLLVENGGNTIVITLEGGKVQNGMCVGGSMPRFWFPNSGGWFGFYDRNGVPQDAVSWGDLSGESTKVTCIPTRDGCNTTITQLGSYNDFPSDRKKYIFTEYLLGGFISMPGVENSWGQSLLRIPDGGDWLLEQGSGAGQYTLGGCNDVCATLGSSSCDGTATVNVTGGSGNYTYSWNDSEGQLTQTATGLCAGTYQVTVTDQTTSQSQTFSVTVDEYVPNVTFDWNETVCNEGQSVPITGFSPTAGTGQTGVLSGTGVSGSSFNVATAGNGSFQVTYNFTDENGCTNSATGNITVNPMPTPAISGINANYCLSDQTIQPTLTPAGGTLSGPGVSNNAFNILAAGVGVHTLTYEVTQNGCTASTAVTVEITGSTPPQFTIQDEICSDGDPITLTGTPTGGTFTINGQTITTFNPTTYGPGTYTVAYNTTDPNNPECLAQATDQITVLPAPTITTNTPTVFCFNAENYTVVMNPQGGQLSGDLISGNTLQVNGAAAGNYTFTYNYTSPEGCSNSYTHHFTIQQELKVEFETAQDCFQNVTLTAVPVVGTFASYQWMDGSTIIGGNSNTITEYISPAGNHNFTLNATSAQGCKATYSEIVDIAQGITADNFQIPNVITPNNDGKNDEITMPKMDEDCLEYKVLIMNRWGQTVYTCDKDNPTFSGKTQGGTDLGAGVYFYKLVSNDFDCSEDPYKPRCHGFITIVR